MMAVSGLGMGYAEAIKKHRGGAKAPLQICWAPLGGISTS